MQPEPQGSGPEFEWKSSFVNEPQSDTSRQYFGASVAAIANPPSEEPRQYFDPRSSLANITDASDAIERTRSSPSGERESQPGTATAEVLGVGSSSPPSTGENGEWVVEQQRITQSLSQGGVYLEAALNMFDFAQPEDYVQAEGKDALKMGYMEKMGEKNKAFRSRFFVLQCGALETSAELAYFDLKGKKQKGCIPILNLEAVRMEMEATCDLVLVTQSRVYRMRCRNEEDCRAWYAVLDEAMKACAAVNEPVDDGKRKYFAQSVASIKDAASLEESAMATPPRNAKGSSGNSINQLTFCVCIELLTTDVGLEGKKPFVAYTFSITAPTSDTVLWRFTDRYSHAKKKHDLCADGGVKHMPALPPKHNRLDMHSKTENITMRGEELRQYYTALFNNTNVLAIPGALRLYGFDTKSLNRQFRDLERGTVSLSPATADPRLRRILEDHSGSGSNLLVEWVHATMAAPIYATPTVLDVIIGNLQSGQVVKVVERAKVLVDGLAKQFVQHPFGWTPLISPSGVPYLAVDKKAGSPAKKSYFAAADAGASASPTNNKYFRGSMFQSTEEAAQFGSYKGKDAAKGGGGSNANFGV